MATSFAHEKIGVINSGGNLKTVGECHRGHTEIWFYYNLQSLDCPLCKALDVVNTIDELQVDLDDLRSTLDKVRKLLDSIND